jgi:nucleotide-binding universal stress UspA family protein
MDSRSTITRAITLAKDTNSMVIFLYVVNQDLAQNAGMAQAHIATEQIRQMGQSVLLAAQAMANSQGMTARSVMRHGNVENEIAQTCRELNAKHLVLGPAGSRQGEGYFTPSLLARFVKQIEKESEIKVILPE